MRLVRLVVLLLTHSVAVVCSLAPLAELRGTGGVAVATELCRVRSRHHTLYDERRSFVTFYFKVDLRKSTLKQEFFLYFIYIKKKVSFMANPPVAPI